MEPGLQSSSLYHVRRVEKYERRAGSVDGTCRRLGEHLNKITPSYKMYHKHPPENWMQKGVRAVEGGLKIYGTAQAAYQAGSAVASGLRSAYQVAGPMLALI